MGSLVRSSAVVGALVVAAAAAGCGSSDDKGLSKAEFVKQSDAVCTKGAKAIDKAGKETFGSGQPSEAAIAKFVKQTVVPGVRGQLADLRKLDPPKDDADQVNAIFDAVDAAVKKVDADPSLATQQAAGDPFAKANKLAKAYGLKACGTS